ncbi:hypothetical protein [Alteraurantiacibacter aquimixticola]|uniref:Uncharacterized protein n=1 Tax=Alteraurantiacibacter aquimixticola TaxID=2489173 RepID=A0A4T3F646_9SPHN|nr:hypothetical protein [Alteraurantiacibacter aquimixticola]TIX51884.1 hypothetical protein E5222_05440 [Alteraurantiacibacter aquimixticola]
MSRVWMSSVKSNYALGDKPGLRSKFYGYDWTPAEFKIPLAPDDVYANMKRAGEGFALRREELPEAAAVWNEKRFKLLGDIFYTGGFLVVRGKLAEVLARFDLGEGGLIPFTIYQADLETPYPGEFFLLNFGCRKNTLLPELSSKVVKFVVEKKTGIQFWKTNDWEKDPVALSPGALQGPDLWFEEVLYNKIFMSDALAQAIIDIGMKDAFALEECRIVEDAQ